jgi:hypothetical protein
MGVAAHKVVDNLANSLPRCVSAPAERLIGARSNPAAQHREGSVPSECGWADPSYSGLASRPGKLSLGHHRVWFETTPGVRRHVLEVLRQPIDKSVIYIIISRAS